MGKKSRRGNAKTNQTERARLLSMGYVPSDSCGTLIPAPRMAMHEASHAVIDARLELPGFLSVDLKRRTHETDPKAVPPGTVSLAMTTTVWPEVITHGYLYRRALAGSAPVVAATIYGYDDDNAIEGDARELRSIALNELGIDDAGLDSWVMNVFRLVRDLMSDPCVRVAIVQTARNLQARGELSADEVRGFLKEAEAVLGKPLLPLSDEIQKLIAL